jgi:bacillithiol synthase
MEIHQIPLINSQLFSKLILDYSNENPDLKELVTDFPSVDSVKKNLEKFSFAYLDRISLSEILTEQYSGFDISETIQKNIQSLKDEKTFTVTTGHQLCLFTGPAYFIYKIISCIKVCEKLNAEIPGSHFVPVYWMATEDHDLEEIDHAFLYGKKIKWEIGGRGRAGDLGTAGTEKALSELKAVLGNSAHAGKINLLFEETYLKHETLGAATRFLVNELFGKLGLLVLDGNSAKLKKLFSSEIKKELLSGKSFHWVTSSAKLLEAKGYSSQVTPREINLFYAGKNSRERIVKEEGRFKVLNTTLAFSEEEILAELEKNPSAFSPNVVLRPLYQQKILPNIIYCGGPGEIAYWVQYKKMFDEENIHFPFLVLRNFVLMLEKSNLEKWSKLGFSIPDFFRSEEELIKDFVKRQSGEVSLAGKKKEVEKLFSELELEAGQTDKTLVSAVAAEKQKTLNAISTLEAKFNRALKQKNETGITQINTLRSKVFPGGVFQERQENFFAFANKYGMELIGELLADLPSALEKSVVSVVVK